MPSPIFECRGQLRELSSRGNFGGLWILAILQDHTCGMSVHSDSGSDGEFELMNNRKLPLLPLFEKFVP